MPHTTFLRVQNLTLAARNFFANAALRAGSRPRELNMIGEQLMTRQEAEALLRQYRRSLSNMR